MKPHLKPRELDKLIEASGKTPRQFLTDLIEEHGNVAAAVSAIGISRQAFYDQCDKHNVTIRRVRKPNKMKKQTT